MSCTRATGGPSAPSVWASTKSRTEGDPWTLSHLLQVPSHRELSRGPWIHNAAPAPNRSTEKDTTKSPNAARAAASHRPASPGTKGPAVAVGREALALTCAEPTLNLHAYRRWPLSRSPGRARAGGMADPRFHGGSPPWLGWAWSSLPGVLSPCGPDSPGAPVPATWRHLYLAGAVLSKTPARD